MRIFHYYARYLEHPSGVTQSLDHWARLAREDGHQVTILTAKTKKSRSLPPHSSQHTRAVFHTGRRRTSWIPLGLLRQLRRGDLLYLHEGWVPGNAAAAAIAHIRGAKVILMPHGVYEPGIVSAIKDPLTARTQLEKLTVKLSDYWHIFYPTEADLLAGMNPAAHAKLVVLPNGAPEVQQLATWNGRGDYFLWMGRFDPEHKGLDNLITSWSSLRKPPRLRLVGPDFMGGKERVYELIREHGLDGVVTIESNAVGERKQRLIEECRAYVHPSRWESCSITLLEMLSSGVPTLVSHSIHAAEVLREAGVVGVTDFATGQFLEADLSSVDRDGKMSQRALRWTVAEGSWSAVGARYRTWLQDEFEGGRNDRTS